MTEPCTDCPEFDPTTADYQTAALATANRHEFPTQPTVTQLRLVNWALGLAGESGELADHIKKHVYHGHALDIDYVVKELGDIRWYQAVMAHDVGWTAEDIDRANIAKLRDRYPEGFSSERSINRAS
jgi:NTP pyrophosphatase (non-canonical NTP hydrolase)